MITLGVADVAAARAFYAKLGWTPANSDDGDIAFYQCGGWSSCSGTAPSSRRTAACR